MTMDEDAKGGRLRVNLVLIGFIAILLYFLIAEHRAHLEGILNYLPVLLLLLCPLMHVFMHRGHGRHGHGAGLDAQADDAQRRHKHGGYQ